MSTTRITDLPPEVLAEVIKFLDWKTRIKCEFVSHQFYEACTEFCETTRFPWKGLPKPMLLVISPVPNICCGICPRWSVIADKVRVTLKNDERQPNGFPVFLKSILSKWGPQIKICQIASVDLTSEALDVMQQYANVVSQFQLCRCNFINVPAYALSKLRTKIDFGNLPAYHGGLTIIIDWSMG